MARFQSWLANDALLWIVSGIFAAGFLWAIVRGRARVVDWIMAIDALAAVAVLVNRMRLKRKLLLPNAVFSLLFVAAASLIVFVPNEHVAFLVIGIIGALATVWFAVKASEV